LAAGAGGRASPGCALCLGGHRILENATPRSLALGSGVSPVAALLRKPEMLRQERMGLDLLLVRETRRWIEERPVHHGECAVVQALGRRSA
jgi:hypothetical protein